MTAMIIIIFILQLILTAWAAGITALYFQLIRTIRKMSATDQEAFTALFENDSTILHAISAALRTIEAVEEESTAYKAAIDEELAENHKTADFAMKTIQEARRIYRKASEIADQPVLHVDGDAFIQQIKNKIEEDKADEQ